MPNQSIIVAQPEGENPKLKDYISLLAGALLMVPMAANAIGGMMMLDGKMMMKDGMMVKSTGMK